MMVFKIIGINNSIAYWTEEIFFFMYFISTTITNRSLFIYVFVTDKTFSREDNIQGFV